MLSGTSTDLNLFHAHQPCVINRSIPLFVCKQLKGGCSILFVVTYTPSSALPPSLSLSAAWKFNNHCIQLKFIQAVPSIHHYIICCAAVRISW